MQNKNNRNLIFSSLLITIFAAIGANAGGPLIMWKYAERIPFRWSVSQPVAVYTDIGPFEIVPPDIEPIPNETADGIVAFAAQQWTDVPTSSFQAAVVGDFASIGLPDITGANAGTVIGTENGGGLHVIYDADASVISDFFGAPPNVLGIASPEFADAATGTITEGWVVINAQQRWVGDEQLLNYAGIFTHEFGHSINLAHSQTNGATAFWFDPAAPASCASPGYDPYGVQVDDIETMYPYLSPVPEYGTGIAQSTVDKTDDHAAISNLYPAPGYPAARGSIKGRVLQKDGRTGLTGINVVARNVDDPFGNAVSAMSGDYVRVAAGNDGTYTLNGLTPGAQYALYIDTIVAGGFPTDQPLYLPEGGEFYNGAKESGNGLTDNRCQITPITAVAGRTTTADIVLNSVKGAPKFTPMVPGAFARTISSDGSVIGGSISGGGTFRFTERGGYQVLNQSENVGSVMSRDGNWFASETQNGSDGYISTQSSILQLGGEWQRIPVPVAPAPAVADPCDTTSHSWGIAGNGKAVSGMYWVDANGNEEGGKCRAWPFLWTPENGSVHLPIPADTRSARPNNMSDDGSTVVGWYESNGSGFRRGARWTNGNFQEFSTPELEVGEAQNVTPNGSFIVGEGAGDFGEAWLWSSGGGLQILGRFGFLGSASANAVSDDGQVVSGFGGSTSFFPGDISGNRAFLWTPELGFADFEDFLRAQGTSFEGWILSATISMSSNGLRHIGVGASPRGGAGWIIDLDKVNMCHASPANPTINQTINVPFRGGMNQHLGHGDTIGVCSDEIE